MRSILSCLLVLTIAAPLALAADRSDFTCIGPMGTGGATFTPIVSPFDHNLMFLTCDMSGVYRSTDAGKTWQVIHYRDLYGALSSRPAFTSKAIYWSSGDYEYNIRISNAGGQRWTPMAGPPAWKDPVTHIAAIDGGAQADTVIVGAGTGVWIRRSAADAPWRRVAEGRCAGIVVNGDKVYAAIQSADGQKHQALMVSADAGKTWKDQPLGLDAAKGHPITSLCGTTAGGEAGQSYPILYAALDNVGILKSIDGEHWQVVMPWDGQKEVLVPSGQDKVAYACQHGEKIWKTIDGGKTWTSIFHLGGPDSNVEPSWSQRTNNWGYSVMQNGLGIDPRNPDVVLAAMIGDFYRSTDGGKSWKPIENVPLGMKRGQGPFYQSIGLECTGCYNFYFAPGNPNLQFMACSDIGLARSIDGGRSWASSHAGSPWENSFYELAFAPLTKDRVQLAPRIFAACSNYHDIPTWNQLVPMRGNNAVGGLCVSDDGGATWKQHGGPTLPNKPVTSVIIDPKSGPDLDQLVLYVTVYDGGVYKSADGGRTWQQRSHGLGNDGNLHACRVRFDTAGSLYCLITGNRVGMKHGPPGGVWKSTDAGESWTDITRDLQLDWPTGFAVSPRDLNTIYVTAGTVKDRPQGGIYKTTDGGKSWKRLLKDEDFAPWCPPSFVHVANVVLHPDDPNIVYLCSWTHGLWVSTDGGEKWRVFRQLPFKSIRNVAFDPRDPKTISVNAWGAGVWRGSYLPSD